MHDISNRDDIEMLVNSFYKKVVSDPEIGNFFNQVVKLDWAVHIPIMYDFWETTLLGIPKYKGNPMIKHIDLNQKSPLLAHHFDRWLELWKGTLSELFSGQKADDALIKAIQISQLMQIKIAQSQR